MERHDGQGGERVYGVPKLMLPLYLRPLILLLSIVPANDGVSRHQCQLTELNHFYDEHGRLVFDQIIFYAIDDAGAEEVLEWRLLKHPSQVPVRDWQYGGYVSMWLDGGQIRKVRTNNLRESWTQFDPELLARDVLPKEQRRGLRRP